MYEIYLILSFDIPVELFTSALNPIFLNLRPSYVKLKSLETAGILLNTCNDSMGRENSSISNRITQLSIPLFEAPNGLSYAGKSSFPPFLAALLPVSFLGYYYVCLPPLPSCAAYYYYCSNSC